ncbi:methylmalonate-semialdehyde dehydrogenase (acylating) [Saprolegnia diclina VS20]|uniref:methylmalonate-semialdehyde dehydrogenase (CoA acylating) n=1 Tax=Saprolegnia diclina (strain VS20) TaxID=1156394 RepID=T0RT84_SAPDV|nr:methylmalonate-semialdehyde dehydrogenase (acylating) [Saprolegnia diclina VS20]EQC33462.1 methylmalonate-semialdehyde dehydrogenase (acylating) [Saprolegnia diclina VS20]|eukprot:XP_008613102.1 methylmalonate-semialdehyde dehydrogenase (acylating) [Saprolegnia diclina VS20]
MPESPSKKLKTSYTCDNYVHGRFAAPTSGAYLDIESPVTGAIIGKVAVSTAADVAVAVEHAKKALPGWSGLTVKARAAIMLKFHELMRKHADELADLVVLENGKNKSEALASVIKGNETVEYACSLPQLLQGKTLEVSRGITCQETRAPLGVIASIVPFNFPIMVPMWTVPIALTTGNCVILKPSEKVPITMTRVASFLSEAGVPPGVFQIVHGQAEAVTSLCDHPDVAAVTFVGSSPVAQKIARRCRALDKRVLALGGAKNHLVALPDADLDLASKDIVASFAGCAGQRCMAASVLLLVGNCHELLESVVQRARNLMRGTGAGQVGAIIDAVSQKRILKYINDAEASGATVLVDGRAWATETAGHGYWVGPTVLLHTNPADAAMHDEIFGPVLSVYKVHSADEALAIENASPFGNAACIYTSHGGHAEHFASRFQAAMIGVNIGVPVPREPFSFGGLYGTKSKYGDMDITGDGCVEFCTHRRKITSKWSLHEATLDRANFAGQM